MLEGTKAIWAFLVENSGYPLTLAAVEKAMRRSRDPIPAEWFNGRWYGRTASLKAWIDRQRQPRKRRSRSQQVAA